MTVEEKKWLRFRIAALLSLFLVFFVALIPDTGFERTEPQGPGRQAAYHHLAGGIGKRDYF
jgi:hypothetical protein